MITLKTKLPKDVVAMALYPFVLVNRNKRVDECVINHEKIHLRQQIELLILPFYLWYGIEYLVRLIRYRDSDKAYRSISFEKEAYTNETDLHYLRNRSLFSFLKYV